MVQLRPLGNTGLSIAPLVLGGNVFGVNGMDRDKSFAVLDAFVGGGGTMLDDAQGGQVGEGARASFEAPAMQPSRCAPASPWHNRSRSRGPSMIGPGACCEGTQSCRASRVPTPLAPGP